MNERESLIENKALKLCTVGEFLEVLASDAVLPAAGKALLRTDNTILDVCRILDLLLHDNESTLPRTWQATGAPPGHSATLACLSIRKMCESSRPALNKH